MTPLGGHLGEDDITGAFLPSHIYVHVPFCASKCDYCDFYSICGAPPDLVRAVFIGIRSQLRLWASAGLSGVIETIYFGGGTPSAVADEVVETLDYIGAHFVVHPTAEITVEGNPDSLTPSVVSALAHAGVGRVSVGVQSFDDHVLRVLGRRHDSETAWAVARRVVGAGLELSVDLMCGIPGQSLTSWTETLQKACATGARHASVYPLAVEEGTALDVAIEEGLVPEVDPDVQAEMMLVASEVLSTCHLHRYEVANYASSTSTRSKHNSAYWTGSPYIGVGPAAHGMLDASTARAMGFAGVGSTAARVRYYNAADVDEWLVGHGDGTEELSEDEMAREDVMLGLRLVEGVPVEAVEQAGVGHALRELASDGLVVLEGGRWRTTQRGWLLGNEVFERVWAPEP